MGAYLGRVSTMPGNATAQFQEPSRLRPSNPLQRPGALGLLLESGLLPALYAEARLHGLSGLDVALAPDGQLTLFCAGAGGRIPPRWRARWPARSP